MTISRRSLLTVVPAGRSRRSRAAGDPGTRRRPATRGPNASSASPTPRSRSANASPSPAPIAPPSPQDTFPEVKNNLIDTGKVRWVFHDFPLDQVALTAAMVARYLPVDRYEPFVNALFASQDRWAFARGGDPTDELWKIAGLAGMSRATFDKAIGDTDLRDWILQQQKADTEQMEDRLDSELRDQRPEIRRGDELRRLRQADPRVTPDRSSHCRSVSAAFASPGSRASPNRPPWRSCPD